ncbi:MAG: HAD family hydrolase [Candidatus Freyarchaeota archaeon]|mgnify:CR=1 FL=1
MIVFSIPGVGDVRVENVVFDLNGTLSMNGVVPPEVQSKVRQLSKTVNVVLLSSDTRGNLAEVGEMLGARWKRVSGQALPEDVEKEKVVEELGAENTIAVGNGRNDALMLKKAKIGIVVIGEEGASSTAIMNADIVVTSPLQAIEMILDPQKIVATMRR